MRPLPRGVAESCLLAALVFAGAAGGAAPDPARPASVSQRRFGPGVCGPVDPSYISGATATGGQLFFLSTAEISQSARLMSASFNSELLLWAGGEGAKTYSVQIDPSVKRASFSGSFDNTGGTLSVVSPDGVGVQQREKVEDTLLNCGRVVTIESPAAGLWQVAAAPSGRFWLVVHAKTELSIVSTEFVAPGGRPGHEGQFKIQGQPIAGRPARLRVALSSAAKNPAFHFVSIDAQPLLTFALPPESDDEFIGLVTLPDQPFRVMVSGVDGTGSRFQRMFPALLHAEVVEVVPSNRDDTIAAGETTPVTFTIRNLGPAVRLRLTASGARGKLQPVEPSTAQIDSEAELTVTVLVTVPADAAPGSDASVLLTAAGDGASTPMNYAQKRLTVRARQ